MKKLALFDIDKTIYNGYTLFPLATYQLAHGLIRQKYIDVLSEDEKLFRSGIVEYEHTVANLCTHWANGLKGQQYQAILQNARDFFATSTAFFPYFAQLIEILSHTHDIYLVTGEPQFIGQPITDLFKVAGFISTEFEVNNDHFTGKVTRYLAKRTEKQEAIKELLDKYGRSESFAFGDSEGDVEMLGSAENPVCVNASKGLQQIALDKGWIIKKPEDIGAFIKEKLSKSLD